MPTPLKPKYRLLTRIELQTLEKDFILFLASQGISADLWQKYQKTNPEKVRELIVHFSDIILEKAYCNCQLIEEVTANGWLFYCFDDENRLVKLVGITLPEANTHDLRKMDRNAILQQIESGTTSGFNLIRASKAQQEDKASEVDQMIKRGGFISNDRLLYKQLVKLASD